MSRPDLPFNALSESDIEREALAVVCGLDGLAIGQALAVLEQAKALILVTQRIAVTPELTSAAEAAGSRHAAG